METVIRNIIANSQDSKMLRSDIFEYWASNSDVESSEIRTALNNLKNDGIIISKLVPGKNYDVTEYSLSEDYKEALLHI